MAEPPVCSRCGARHWFLDPCGQDRVAEAGPLAATASADEIEKALAYYRAHKERERARQARKRAGHKG